MSNAAAEVDEARRLAKLLIDQEARRIGSRVHALGRVARNVGAAPGTLENLTRGRLKSVPGWLRDALRARVIRELEAEIVRLQHELAVLHQTGVDPRANEVAAVRADIAAILETLGRRER